MTEKEFAYAQEEHERQCYEAARYEADIFAELPAAVELAFSKHKKSVGSHWEHEDAITEDNAEVFALSILRTLGITH